MDITENEILVRRARSLARARAVDASVDENAGRDRYLVTRCGNERIAIRLTSLAEVYKPGSVTPLPRPTAPVWGLAAWRGRILTVVTIGDCLPGSGPGMIAVLAEGSAAFAGVWINDVEVEEYIADDDIVSARGMTGGREFFLTGTTGDAVLVLDATQLKVLLEREIPVSDKKQ
ncbi:MAG: chemotaxis protein CheW [Gemmatimonadaceae bacterium]